MGSPPQQKHATFILGNRIMPARLHGRLLARLHRHAVRVLRLLPNRALQDAAILSQLREASQGYRPTTMCYITTMCIAIATINIITITTILIRSIPIEKQLNTPTSTAFTAMSRHCALNRRSSLLSGPREA